MRSLSLMFLAILIAITSFQVFDLGDYEFSSHEQLDSLSTLDHTILTPIKEIVSKKTLSLSYIAQDFIPIVLIAVASVVVSASLSYLPLYSQFRHKNFYLRI